MTKESPLGGANSQKSSLLDFDAEEFAHFLEDTGWTDAQKCEFVELVWQIICEIIDLRYGSHPVQQVACGKTLDVESPPMLDSGGISDFQNQNAVGQEWSAVKEDS